MRATLYPLVVKSPTHRPSWTTGLPPEGARMCGIAGIAGRPGLDPQRGETVRRMAATLVHRGPDGEGLARRDGCDLGFRRLAIVDVASPAQIMADEDRGVWSVCNGEIYNSAALRARLL